VDAAIFGSGAVTYIAAIGGGRSTVPLTRGAGICGFPFASSFLLALSFFPVSLDPTRSEEKEIPSETRRNFGGCHAQLTQEPTKQRRFIDTFLVEKCRFFAVPLQIRGIQVMEGWCLVRRGGKKIFRNGGQ
jgi:hypothetical protein